jgi:hypothetical protein
LLSQWWDFLPKPIKSLQHELLSTNINMELQGVKSTSYVKCGHAYTSANRLMVNAFDHITWMRMTEHFIMDQYNKQHIPKLLHLAMQLCDTPHWMIFCYIFGPIW